MHPSNHGHNNGHLAHYFMNIYTLGNKQARWFYSPLFFIYDAKC